MVAALSFSAASISAFFSSSDFSCPSLSPSSSPASATAASSAAFAASISALNALSEGQVPSLSTSWMMFDMTVMPRAMACCVLRMLASTSGVPLRFAHSSSVVARICSATLSDSSLFLANACAIGRSALLISSRSSSRAWNRSSSSA